MYISSFTTMNNITNTFLVSFSKPNIIKKSKSISLKFCKILIKNNEIIDFYKLSKIFNFHELNKITLITVTKNTNINTVLEKDYKFENTIIKNYIVPSNIFFSEQGIKSYIIEQNIIIRNRSKNPSFGLYYEDISNINELGFTIFKFEDTI